MTEEHLAALEYQWAQVARLMGAGSSPRAVTFDKVQAYVVERRNEGALGQTIAREVSALKRGLMIARRRGWVLVLPDEWPTVKRDPKGAKRSGRLHPPSILAAWLRELHQDARDVATIAILTGLRKTELRRLAANWIEPAPAGLGVTAILRVPAASAKSRKEGIVPLPDTGLEVLQRRAETAAPGGPLLGAAEHKTAFRLARQRIGYVTPISLRDLRKTWATLATRAVGVDAAQGGLRHSSLATTSRYVDADLGRIATASRAVEASITGTPKSAQKRKRGAVERATRLELATLSLGSRGHRRDRVLSHVKACVHCLREAEAHLEVLSLPLEVGTVGRHSASPGRRGRGSR